MAKVIAIGQPVNDSERQAIAHLRDHLPASFTILHNFEIQVGNELFEVDLAVVAPHAVYLVDVKGTRGDIDVYGGNGIRRVANHSARLCRSCVDTRRCCQA
jgi:hypothetical protein